MSKHLTLALALVYTLACAGKRTRDGTPPPKLSEMRGKRVAVVDIDGEPTARRVVEVALINQIKKRGTFILVNKREVEAAKVRPEFDVDDHKTVARSLKADYTLSAKVLKFDATTREGYSEEKVHDSQLEADTGNGETTRLYKVKSVTGDVQVEMQFYNLEKNALTQAVASKKDVVTVEGKRRAVRLPPKLRYLEKLTNQALDVFFEENQ